MATTLAQLEEPRIELGRALRLAGLSRRFTGESRGDIPGLWMRFAPYLCRVPLQTRAETYGVCFEPHEGGEGFAYMAAIEVSAFRGLPEEFSHMEIPEQRYAVFPHRGHISELPLTCDMIWSQWAPATDRKIKHGGANGLSFFEFYDADFRPDPGIGHVELWIPIQ